MQLFWQALTALTGLVLIISWYDVSGKTIFDDQKPGIDIAIAALVVSCALDALFVLAGRRAVGLRRAQLLASIPVPRKRTGAVAPALAGLVAGDGLTRYHRTSCQFVEGRGWPTTSLAEHQAAGRTPCGVCAP
jgi:hypothetical protein